MGLRTLLVLVALVAALLAVLLWTDQKPKDTGAVAVPVLDGHRLRTAVRVEWQYREQPPLQLRREPGGPFRLSHPVDDLASFSQVQALGDTYDSAQLGETPLVDDEANRRKVGLEPPRLTVDLAFEDGSEVHLQIGDEGATGNEVFVRRVRAGGDDAPGRIYRGSLGLYTVLRSGLDDWRERQVFLTPPSAIREVVVDRAHDGSREVMRLARSGDGWKLIEPIRATADAGAATAFVGNVLALHIDEFVAGMLTLPEGPPDVVLTVRGGTADEVVRLWVDAMHELYGRLDGRGIGFKCSAEQNQRIFSETADELRSRVLVPIADLYHELATMMVEPGGDAPRLVLHRDSADQPWQFQEPITGPVSQEAANQLMTAINNLRALAFAPAGTDPAAVGLGPGGLRIGTQSFSMPAPRFLRIGDACRFEQFDAAWAARVEAPDELVKVPLGAVGMLRRSWAEYVSPRIFRVQESVTRVDLRRRDGQTRRLVVGDGGTWRDPSGRAVDDAVTAELVDRLRDLEARRVRLASELQLAEPDWSLKLSRATDPDEDPIGFGALDVFERGDGPIVVRSRTGLAGVVFELSKLDGQQLQRLWQ